MRIPQKCQAPFEDKTKRMLPAGQRVFLCAVFLALFSVILAPQSRGFAASTCDVSWKAYRLPDVPPAEKGKPLSFIALEITLTPSSGVYIYGPKVSEGLPTRVAVREEGEGAPSLSTLAPVPVAKKKSRLAGVSAPGVSDGDTLIYDGPAVFLVKAPVRESGEGTVALVFQASGLMCSSKSCTPFKSKQSVRLSADALKGLPEATGASWWPEFEKYSFDPAPFDWTPPENSLADSPAVEEAGAGTLSGDGAGGQAEGALAGGQPGLFSGGNGSDAFSVAPSRPDTAGENIKNAESQITADEGEGETAPELTRLRQALVSVKPRYDNASLEVSNLGTAVFFGLIAGFLLNLMPCVLPVISLKFSALLAVSAMEDKKQQARLFREHNLIFAAGILAWFFVLAVLLGTAGLAWGEMFQSPYVVSALAVLLFLLGLSLFGVFSLPVFDLKFGSSNHPRLQAFGSGLLATLLATPCSGPLLGGVLGWALRQPLPVLASSVISVGFGMALPYCILALYPGLVNLLPRPGAWTLRLEQLLGFFLMGTVVYLVTLLPEGWLTAVLVNMVIVAFAAWLWGQVGHLGASTARRAVARVGAVIFVAFGIWWGVGLSSQDFTWEEFEPVMFTEALGEAPLIVDFTADWCASCKAMEKTTLNTERMKEIRAKYKNVRLVRVDLTRDNDAGWELLKTLGSESIPVVALFPSGLNHASPLVLRDLVTPSRLEEALAHTF